MKTLKLVNNLYSVVHTSLYHSNAPAIADTGAYGHYLKADAPHDLALQPVAPIKLKQPNDQILKSTNVCRLALKKLPEGDIEARILLRLAHRSLISIGKLCDVVCEASFNQNTMAVTKDEQAMLQGTRYIMKGLWRVPLQRLDIPTHQSNHLHQVNGKEHYIKLLHASEFSPVQHT